MEEIDDKNKKEIKYKVWHINQKKYRMHHRYEEASFNMRKRGDDLDASFTSFNCDFQPVDLPGI